MQEKFTGDEVRVIPVDIDRNEIFDAVEEEINKLDFSFSDAFSWTYRQDGQVFIEFEEGSMIVDVYLNCHSGRYTVVAKIREIPR